MFARTYAPSKAPEAVKAWRGDLQAKNRPKLATAVADPSENPELFEEGWEEALQREAGGPASESPLANGDSGMFRLYSPPEPPLMGLRCQRPLHQRTRTNRRYLVIWLCIWSYDILCSFPDIKDVGGRCYRSSGEAP